MAPLFKRAYAVKFFILSLVAGSIAVGFLYDPTAAEKNGGDIKLANNQPQQQPEVQEVTGPLTVNVILKRHYLDGQISEEVVEETIWSMEDFWAQYADWQLVTHKQGQIIFKKNMDDISPLLKANGYFGISEDGTLTIYKGVPQDSPEVIQSFFQIDISKLESRQQEELKKGIPVVSKDHYQKVIESFKTFSIKQ